MVGYFNGVHRAKSEVFLSLRKSVYLVQGPQPGEMLDIPEQFQAVWSISMSRTFPRSCYGVSYAIKNQLLASKVPY